MGFMSVPFMQKVYGKSIFSPAYEDNCLFETLFIQDRLMQYRRFDGKNFFVRKSCDSETLKKAENELYWMLTGSIRNKYSM